MIARTTQMLEAERVIAFRPEVARFLGSRTAAILFQQLSFWAEHMGGMWFYKSARELEDETTLTEKEQRTARKILVDKEFIETKLGKAEGVPTMHYLVKTSIKTTLVGLPSTLANGQMDSAETPNGFGRNAKSITIEDNNRLPNIDKSILGGRDKRDPDVQLLIEHFEKESGIQQPALSRRYAQLLIRKYGLDSVKSMVSAAARAQETDKFCPRTPTLEKFWFQKEKLQDYFRRKGNTVLATTSDVEF